MEPASSIEIRTPFPADSFPLLHLWAQSFWNLVADDNTPTDVVEFTREIVEQVEKYNCITWGVYRDGELGGYLVFQPMTWAVDEANHILIPYFGTIHCMFKRAFWGHDNTRRALDLMFAELFGAGTQALMLTVFETNPFVRGLAKSMGAKEVGPLKGRHRIKGQVIDDILLCLTPDNWHMAKDRARKQRRDRQVKETAKQPLVSPLA